MRSEGGELAGSLCRKDIEKMGVVKWRQGWMEESDLGDTYLSCIAQPQNNNNNNKIKTRRRRQRRIRGGGGGRRRRTTTTRREVEEEEALAEFISINKFLCFSLRGDSV